eukprot:10046621-Alexandrium_andersonii.AAC.1
MLEGIYAAMEGDPSNKFCELLRQVGGIPGVVLVEKNTPTDALLFTKDEGNECNSMGAKKAR